MAVIQVNHEDRSEVRNFRTKRREWCEPYQEADLMVFNNWPDVGSA